MEQLEIYVGDQQQAEQNRYYKEPGENGYANVKLPVEFPLDDFPEDWMKITFVKEKELRN